MLEEERESLLLRNRDKPLRWDVNLSGKHFKYLL
jgi:hypothetical protein